MPTLAVTDHVARIVTTISVYGALAMAALLLYLVVRRDQRERSRARDQEDMRQLTREVLAALSDPATARPIFDRAHPRARLTAIGHIGQLLRGGDRDQLVAFVEQQELLHRAAQRVASGSRRARVEAIRLLGSIGGPRALDVLRNALRDERHDEIRLEAATMLARLDGLPPPGTLIEQLRLTDAPITPLHRALFRTLAAHRADELIAIAQADLPPEVRALLIDALGWTEDYSALPILAEVARDANTAVRLAAIDAASRIGHPSAASWIIGLLADPEPTVRARAVRACQSLGIQRSLPQIIELRSDTSPWVRLRAQQAAQALAAV